MNPDLSSTLLFIIGGAAMVNGSIGLIAARTTVGTHNQPTALRGMLARVMSLARMVIGIAFILVGDAVLNGPAWWDRAAVVFGVLGVALIGASAVAVHVVAVALQD
jgi:hypothetical protein